MLKMNVFFITVWAQNIRQFDFEKIKYSLYNRSSKSCSISASAVTNHEQARPKQLKREALSNKRGQRDFTPQHQSSVWNNFILWADVRFLSQNEADNIFYTVKALSIII